MQPQQPILMSIDPAGLLLMDLTSKIPPFDANLAVYTLLKQRITKAILPTKGLPNKPARFVTPPSPMLLELKAPKAELFCLSFIHPETTKAMLDAGDLKDVPEDALVVLPIALSGTGFTFPGVAYTLSPPFGVGTGEVKVHAPIVGAPDFTLAQAYIMAIFHMSERMVDGRLISTITKHGIVHRVK